MRVLEDFVISISAINTRNQFKGMGQAVIRGPVLSEIDMQTVTSIITSAITTRSIDGRDLYVGSEMLRVFKSSGVMLAKLRGRGVRLIIQA